MRRLTQDEITDIAINVMLAKGYWNEKKAIEVGEKFNALREKTGRTADASKQSYQTYVLSSLVVSLNQR